MEAWRSRAGIASAITAAIFATGVSAAFAESKPSTAKSGVATAAQADIIGTAVGAGQFNTLAKALTAAGLVPTLKDVVGKAATILVEDPELGKDRRIAGIVTSITIEELGDDFGKHLQRIDLDVEPRLARLGLRGFGDAPAAQAAMSRRI